MKIDNTNLLDGLTTVLLAAPAVILIFKGSIEAYAPPEYLAIIMLFLAVVSQLAAGERSRFAVDKIKKWKYFDYLTTIFLAIYPFLIGYQDQLLNQLPPSWKIVGLVFFAGLSQYAANKRVQKAEPVTASLQPQQLNSTSVTITPDPEVKVVTPEGEGEEEDGA